MAGFTQKEDTPLQVERKVQKAKKVLGFETDFVPYDWEVAIRERYTSLVKSHHPDAAGQVSELPHEYDLDEIRRAKDYLLKELENDRIRFSRD